MKLDRLRPSHLVDVSFADIDMLCESVRSWDLDFRPLRRAAGGGSIGRISQCRWGTIELSRARLEVNLDQLGAPPPGKATFVVLEPGTRRLWWRRHDVEADTVLVFPIGSELSSVSGSDFHIHTISLDEETIGAIGATLHLDLPPPSARSECFRPPAPVLGELRALLRSVSVAPAEAAPAQIRRIAELLVLHWLTSMQRKDALRVPDRHRDAAIRRCLALMEDVDWAELNASLLRQASGLSERSLQYAFRERFGLTPAAFIKARRLAAAHHDLSNAMHQSAGVADISSVHGFWHVGQFAADYRRVYGELPSQTLSRSGGPVRALRDAV